jgi:hypothetical protein
MAVFPTTLQLTENAPYMSATTYIAIRIKKCLQEKKEHIRGKLLQSGMVRCKLFSKPMDARNERPCSAKTPSQLISLDF